MFVQSASIHVHIKMTKKRINGKCLINSVKLVLFDITISSKDYKSLSLHWFFKNQKDKKPYSLV